MKALGVAVIAGLAGLASATPEYWETFQSTYSVKVDSVFEKAECSTCHAQIPSHNAYGRAVNSALQSAKTEILTAVLLEGAEGVDSDGDGWRNGDEIRRGTLPGDATSKPVGEPPAMKMDAGHMGTSGRDMPGTMSGMGEHDYTATVGELIPKHSFHPLLVHFPIALFLFGALLDLFGIRLNRGHVRAAALWNMCAGSVSTVLAIPTGFVAALRMGYPLGYGTAIFGHLAAGISAAFLMLAVVLWRVRGMRQREEPSSWRYVLVLLLASGVVSLAGHWGGGLVYGS